MSKKNYILSVIIAVVAFVVDFLLMVISVFFGWMYTLIVLLLLVCLPLILIWHVSYIVVLFSCLFIFIGFACLSYKLMLKYLACCRKSLDINNRLSVGCKLIPAILSSYSSLITGALLTIHYSSLTFGDIFITICVAVLCLGIAACVYVLEDCYYLLENTLGIRNGKS